MVPSVTFAPGAVKDLISEFALRVSCPIQLSRMSCSLTELQNLLRHKDDSSRAYRERTDTQVSSRTQKHTEVIPSSGLSRMPAGY